MRNIEISGHRVQYVDEGEGDPVVLLHSSASSSAQWRGLIERLSGGYRVIAPDLHGYGGTSAWAGRARFRLEHEANLVLALLGRAGQPAHLVGHSFGGAVALHVARTRPDLLASLTVIEPVAFHLLRNKDVVALVEIMAVAHRIVDAVACGDYFEGAARFVDYWSGPGAWKAIGPEKHPRIAACVAKIALDFEATLNEPATLGDFTSLAVPTLVIQGTCSPRPTRRICELLAGVIPDAELKLIEGAGHMAPLTHRDKVNELIERHVSAVALPACTAATISRTNSLIDVQDEARRVKCPTLILHGRGDARIPFEEGRIVAGLIPGSPFMTLETRNHLMTQNEPAWQHFLDSLAEFYSPAQRPARDAFPSLTVREREILDLIAEGLDNAQIAARLELSEKTVRNNITHIFDKIGVENRSKAIILARESGLGQGRRG